jgi:hypothetical protein
VILGLGCSPIRMAIIASIAALISTSSPSSIPR